MDRLQPSLPDRAKKSLYSENLQRTVTLTILRPRDRSPRSELSVLILFDGQDFPAVRIPEALGDFSLRYPSVPLMIVGIHADKDRIFEYGTASQPDYAYRGNKAANTTHFVIDELIPYLKERYPVSYDRERWSIGGFSLGGLMALDLAWHHAEVFSKVGVFSGSFWWRQRALDDNYDESDRIMHRIIRSTTGSPVLKFWFQTGTRDEEDDRDNDGIIDSIDDTLDLIAELERKGYAWGKEIVYEEVLNGEHNPHTWAEIFPVFLHWSQHR
ncbi:esterase family protein [Cytophagaceae bacterium SJW1-29]|uniref:Esterase family protein n=1 Tax=Salmonirosea aquatica TaxID=2654236 RepID=A0A7C9FT99_9BACT|nr:esterase family protein [Cytophagaceae bacterium SJW1-29]